MTKCPPRSRVCRAMATTATCAVSIFLVATGCARHHEDQWSRQWPARVPTAGSVTFRGSPVEGATVHFVTERQGRFYNAMGQTDTTGRFSLQTFRPKDGAVPGRQKVRIQKLTVSEKPADLPLHASFKPVETSHLPEKYRSPETSGLTVEVSEKGPNEFTFSLE